MLNSASWIGGAAGYWDAAANWSNSLVPTSATNVSISTVGATVTIQSGDAESAKSLAVAAGTLAIVSGSLAIVGSLPAEPGVGLTNNGTIAVNAGCNLTVSKSCSQTTGAAISMPAGGNSTNPAANWIVDPDFESPTLPSILWTWGSSVSLSTQYAYTGSQSLVLSGASSTAVELFSATPGSSYTTSVYAMTPTPLTGGAAAYLNLYFFD